jgi:hypothetical protein
MRSQKSELQKFNAGMLKRIEEQRAEYREWERQCEQVKWPLVVCEFSWEQRKLWLRGVYREGKSFEWM